MPSPVLALQLRFSHYVQERAFLLLHAGQAMENNPPHTSGGSSHEQPEVSNDLNDEEYARRLQDEEQAEHYRHMLALAGAGRCVTRIILILIIAWLVGDCYSPASVCQNETRLCMYVNTGDVYVHC